MKRRAAITLVVVLALNAGAARAGSGPSNGAAAVLPGALMVQSDPAGANVYVDGRLAGHTPLEIGSLSPGDHRVRLVKDGYLENIRVVSVGATPKNVHVKLTPLTGSRNAAAEQVTGGGGGSKKWFWIGLASGGAAAAAVVLATRNSAPVAGSVVANPSGGLASSTAITFTAQGASDPDGDTLTYSWNFGDGSTGTGASVSKTFANAGTFNVTVDVSDGKKSASASGSVTIRNMTGTWNGSIAAFGTLPFSVTLSQTGSTFTGTYVDRDGAGSLSGNVFAESIVRFTVNQPQFPLFTLQGTANAAVSTVIGMVVSGFPGTPSFTMSR